MRVVERARMAGTSALHTGSKLPGPWTTFWALGLAAALLSPGPAAGQDAQTILSEAMDRYRDRLTAVEDLTIRQEIMGVTTTSYLVKESVDGYPLLKPADSDGAATEFGPMDAVGELWASPHHLFVELAHEWSLEGRGSVNGEETWTLVLEDVEAMDWRGMSGSNDAFVAQRVVLELSIRDLVPLSMRLDGEARGSDEPRPFTLHMELSDYREIDGYLHPFLAVVETEGTPAGLSPEEFEEAKESLEVLRQELERMPEEQRTAMERLMGDQVKAFEEMIASGRLRVEVRVTDVRVNSGPPGAR